MFRKLSRDDEEGHKQFDLTSGKSTQLCIIYVATCYFLTTSLLVSVTDASSGKLLSEHERDKQTHSTTSEVANCS